MADKKISALTASSTPLAGTEALPIVQSGSTVQVSVANLTAGRAVSASSLTASTDNVIIGTSGKGITTGSAIPLGFGTNNSVTPMTLDTSGNLLVGNTTQILYVTKELNVNAASGSSGFALATANSARLYMTGSSTDGNITTKGAIPLLFGTDETERMRITATGDVSIANGNLVIGTSGKGIDFSATPGTGTSELLADYEEGTWTPTDTSGAGLTFTAVNCTYTKFGRLVTLSGVITFPVNASALAVNISGFPFAQSATNTVTSALASNSGVSAIVLAGSSNILIRNVNNGDFANLNFSGLFIAFGLTYTV
jgi:hypothetical protein